MGTRSRAKASPTQTPVAEIVAANRSATFSIPSFLVGVSIFASLFGAAQGQATPFEKTSDPSTLPQNWQHFRTSMPALSFSVDERLQRNVDFWVKIYTTYTRRQGLVHDAKYIDKIYETVDVSGAHGMRRARESKKHWKAILLSLHKKTKGGATASEPESLSEDEKRVFQLYLDVSEPNKFLNAAHRKRMRFQLGQRDHFLDGYRQSGRYIGIMEEIFRREGMPIELTRLPFVESSFNIRARSKVGASGIWQFMRSTARLFMRVNEAVDERNDPVRATEAAARLLRLNFESLRNWPLAVTAYNHGRKGMMRAVRRVGSEELEHLVREYRSRSFGFASGNFFTELLAAIEVERNAERYFGKIERDEPLRAVEVTIPDYIALKDLVTYMKLDPVRLKSLNPGLTEAVYRGERLVPTGYRMRIPFEPATDGRSEEQVREETVKVFLAGYEQIPRLYKAQAQRTTRLAKWARAKGKRRISSEPSS